jgi:hypothetical protein
MDDVVGMFIGIAARSSRYFGTSLKVKMSCFLGTPRLNPNKKLYIVKIPVTTICYSKFYSQWIF